MQQRRVAFIVDDDHSIRESIGHALEDYGYRAVEIESGDKLLSLLPIHNPDIIFLDIYMSGLDGIECCKRIRKLPRFDKIPIIMVSVEGAKEIVHKAVEAGANDYILKDIYIVDRLKKAISKYGDITMRDSEPVAPQEDIDITPSPKPIGHPTEHSIGDGKSILIVDDDQSVLNMLYTFFMENGFAVSTAKNGAEGYEMVRTNRYDVILLDIQMPSVNGFELLARLRREGVKTPVILMSSRATYTTLESSVKFGSVILIDKPLNFDTLLKEAENAMSNKPLPKRNRRLLIADDHGATRETLSIFLQEAGYIVTAVSDGDEAITAAKSTPQPFDIAIIDIMMPKMHGEKVVAELKKASPRTLPILITGEATSDEIREGYKEGAFSLIRKPIDFEILLNALISYERECDERQKEIEKEEEYKRLPFYQKAYLWAKSHIDAPPNSPKNLRLRSIMVILLAIITGIALFFVLTELSEYAKSVSEQWERTASAIERASENTEWDRERKERIDRGEIRRPR